jgi:uncharacterized membrane protein YiaA
MALGERFKGTLGALVVAYTAGLWLASLEISIGYFFAIAIYV